MPLCSQVVYGDVAPGAAFARAVFAGAAPKCAAWVWASPPDAEPGAPAECPHPEADRLVELAEGEPPTLGEARHVARCARCVREIAEVVLVIAMVRHGAAPADAAPGVSRAPRTAASRRAIRSTPR